ncbi:MAG: hypothetical protein M1816_003419 [Peltula sp. TS41687]|nr:MAG: hypothetical protein M1816_003419 [Peltula sp. TS41687]
MEKMKFWGAHEGEHHHQQHDEKKEQDLTTLLDHNQLAELTKLVGDATEAMRSNIETNLSMSQIDSDIKAQESAHETDNPNLEAVQVSEEDQEATRQAQEKRQQEVSAPRLQELEKALLSFYDKWRDSVILRVGEVVNARKEDSEHDSRHAEADRTHSSSLRSRVSKHDSQIDKVVQMCYPPIPTSLAEVSEEKRMLIVHSMLLLLLSLEHYTAYSRVLLLYLTSSLNIPISMLAEDETKVAHGLLEAAKHMSADDEAQKRADENKTARRWKVGLASVAGAALIGVTGGLAAPLVAAGVGGLMGGLGLGATAAAGYLGTLAGSSVLVGGLFGAYGGRMTGQMMDAYAREVEDFAFLPVRGTKKAGSSPHESSPEDRRLRVVIGISGWLTEKEEVVLPWRVLGHNTEVFALRYELESLINLGNALTTMITSAVWNKAKAEIIKRTIFASLTAALWPLGLLKVGKIVDNPFSVAKTRSDKAGEVLADAIINRAQGERPVSLVGYSLGARVIYSCLMSLADRQAFGLVESAVLIGVPAPSTASDWRVMRSVVAGRLVNVYSENDYILAFLYRTSSIQYGVAGLQRVEGVQRVENVDVSQTVSGHLRYRYLVGSILKLIGFEDVDVAEVAKQEEALSVITEEEKEQGAGKADDGHVDADEEAKALEDEVRRKNQQSLLQNAAEKLRLR